MRTVTVSDLALPAISQQSMVVRDDAPLEEVIHDFAQSSVLRSIFLVNQGGQLVGVISRQDLLRWVRLRLELTLPAQPLSLGAVRRLLLASRARDIAAVGSQEAAVRLDQSLADAVEKMARHDLTDTPVVNGGGQIVGDLSLSQVLSYTLRRER